MPDFKHHMAKITKFIQKLNKFTEIKPLDI